MWGTALLVTFYVLLYLYCEQLRARVSPLTLDAFPYIHFYSENEPVDIEEFHRLRVGIERFRVPELLFQVKY